MEELSCHRPAILLTKRKVGNHKQKFLNTPKSRNRSKIQTLAIIKAIPEPEFPESI